MNENIWAKKTKNNYDKVKYQFFSVASSRAHLSSRKSFRALVATLKQPISQTKCSTCFAPRTSITTLCSSPSLFFVGNILMVFQFHLFREENRQKKKTNNIRKFEGGTEREILHLYSRKSKESGLSYNMDRRKNLIRDRSICSITNSF